MDLLNWKYSERTLRSKIQGIGFSMASLLLGLSFTSQADELVFDEHTITTAFKLTHPVMAVDVWAKQGKELLVLGVDEKQQKWLGVYVWNDQNGKYESAKSLLLPMDFHSFDLTEPREGELQSFYFLSHSHLYQLDLDNEAKPFRRSFEVSPLALSARPDFISRGEFIRDLNGDGLSDILINDFREVQLLIAQPKNIKPLNTGDPIEEASEVKSKTAIEAGFINQTLPITPQMQLYSDGAAYTQTKVYLADLNLDSRQDIVKIAEGELEVFYQKDNGMFNELAQYIPVHLAISGVNWWNKRDAYGEQLDQSDLTYRKVEVLKDINGDNITDMVVRYTKSSGVLDRVNDYEVYLGKVSNSQLSFPKKPDSVVRGEGTLTGLEFIDIDNDDKDEVLVSGFDIGLSQVIGALISGSIEQDVHLFQMDEQGLFSAEPDLTKAVEMSFSLTSGQTGTPIIQLADLNGDNHKDLILSDGREALRIYLGNASNNKAKSPFVSRSRKIELALPQDGEMLSSEDLNGDGKDDLLIKYGRQDEVSLQSQFKVIIAG